MSLKKKLISNTIYNFMGKAFGIIISILLTPYIIGKVGIDAFAVWAIIFMLGGYLGLFDLGTKWAYQKYIAEYSNKNDDLSINRVINTGLFFYFIIFTALFFLLYIFKDAIPLLLKTAPAQRPEFAAVFVLAFLSFVLNNIFSVFIQIPVGLQRMDISNKIMMWITFLNAAGTYLVLSLGFGLKGLVVNNLIVNIIQIVLFIMSSCRLLRKFRLGWQYVQKAEMKKIVSFGIKNQVASLHELASFQTDKFFLGNYLSLASVSLYEVGTRLLTQIRFICSLIVSAVVPAVSELQVNNDTERILKLYKISSRYIITILLPFLFLMNFYAREIILVWVGGKFLPTVYVFYILSAGYFVNCLAGTGYAIVIGMGKVDINLRFGLLGTVLNLVLSFSMVRLFGFLGLLAGTSLTLVISGTYLIIMSQKLLNVKFFSFWSDLLYKPLIIIIVCFIAGSLMDLVRLPDLNRLTSLIVLSGKCLVISVIYIGLLFGLRYYTREDIKLFQSLLKRE